MTRRRLALACVAAWIGIVSFFSFAVAPVVFRTIDRAAAGEAVSAVLPLYYGWGVVLVAVALIAYAGLLRRGGDRRGDGVAAALCALMLGSLAWAWLVVLPTAEDARRARSDTAFVHAHRRAIELNGLTLAAGIALLALATLRRSPAGSR